MHDQKKNGKKRIRSEDLPALGRRPLQGRREKTKERLTLKNREWAPLREKKELCWLVGFAGGNGALGFLIHVDQAQLDVTDLAAVNGDVFLPVGKDAVGGGANIVVVGGKFGNREAATSVGMHRMRKAAV